MSCQGCNGCPNPCQAKKKPWWWNAALRLQLFYLVRVLAPIRRLVYGKLSRELYATAAGMLGFPGKEIGSARTFWVLNPMSIAVFKGSVVLGETSRLAKLLGPRVIWTGDLNLSDDMDRLVSLSRALGDTIYVSLLGNGNNAGPVPPTKGRHLVVSIRSVGDENTIQWGDSFHLRVQLHEDGKYRFNPDWARVTNRAIAELVLTEQGWLPNDLIEFYGLQALKKKLDRQSKIDAKTTYSIALTGVPGASVTLKKVTPKKRKTAKKKAKKRAKKRA